ncbi:MAG TPA: YwqG family protein [Longimicrobium sp.]|nr:YwqG family protein [Longimicrobium sp.]
MEDLEELEELIGERGLSQHRDAILATARPAILIFLDERTGRSGAGHRGGAGERYGQSRIGGVPDLPESLPWPEDSTGRTRLAFLLQINFSELPVFAGTPFPRRGMLYLFGGADGENMGRVMVYTGSEPLLPTDPPSGKPYTDHGYDDLVPHRLGFQVAPDVPRWATRDFYALCESLGPEYEGEYEYEDALHDLGNTLSAGAVGKLLGHLSGIGYDPREHMAAEDAVDWINLLQVESDDEVNVCFSDAGYLQVLVHPEALEQLDFSRAYVSLESS